jgi:hypothetical protein
MALRVTVLETADLTVIRVDGRLAGEGVAELEEACRLAKRPTVLDLANLMAADDAGVLLLRGLVREGLHLLGASPYAALLLNAPPPSGGSGGPVARSRRRGPGGGKTGTPKRAPRPNTS